MTLEWFALVILLSSCVHPRVYAYGKLKDVNLRPFVSKGYTPRINNRDYQNIRPPDVNQHLTPLDPRMVIDTDATPANVLTTNWPEIMNNVERTSGFQINGGILNNWPDAPPGSRFIGLGSGLPSQARFRAQQFQSMNGGDSFVNSADLELNGNIKNDGISTYLLSVHDVIEGRP